MKKRKLEVRCERLGRLWWLVDAPLFADGALVQRFHDAIVWPAEIEQAKTLKDKVDKQWQIDVAGTAGGEAQLKMPWFLDWLLPDTGVTAKLDLQAGGSRASAKSRETETQITIVRNEQRLLHELVRAYFTEFRDRILFLDLPGGSFSTLDGSIALSDLDHLLDVPPRPLVFMELQKGSVIMPTVAELEGGGFKFIFRSLEKQWFGSNDAPTYPRDEDPNASEKRKQYWARINDKFDSGDAMRALENECDKGRIGWIDFRVPAQ